VLPMFPLPMSPMFVMCPLKPCKGRPIPDADLYRFQARIAGYLPRHPDVTMGASPRRWNPPQSTAVISRRFCAVIRSSNSVAVTGGPSALRGPHSKPNASSSWLPRSRGPAFSSVGPRCAFAERDLPTWSSASTGGYVHRCPPPSARRVSKALARPGCSISPHSRSPDSCLHSSVRSRPGRGVNPSGRSGTVADETE
jgi:hypothetical protein